MGGVGGCPVAEDPDRDGHDAALFWAPDLLPGLVRLVPAPFGPVPVPPTADPLAGPGRRATLPTADGVHVVIADGPRERRFLVLAPDLPEPGTPLLATVAFDAPQAPQIAGIERLAALMRQTDPPAELTPYQTDTLRRVLQGLDAAQAGASLRDTAAALFGERRMSEDWFRSSPLRDQVRYLIRRGRQLMTGGYRDLLAGRLGRDRDRA
ncbi:DUF2285 domain-containing protein [Azospirillum doebereinerae]